MGLPTSVLTTFNIMSALQHSLGTGMRLGVGSPCRHTVLFGNNLLVLPCCSLPARSLRSLHHSTVAMGRRGLAELINVGKHRSGTPSCCDLLHHYPGQPTTLVLHRICMYVCILYALLSTQLQGSRQGAVEAWETVTHAGSARSHSATAVCRNRGKPLDRVYTSSHQGGEFLPPCHHIMAKVCSVTTSKSVATSIL